MSDGALLDLVRRALDEDAASNDITTLATVPADATGHARLVTREDAVIAGFDAFIACFTLLDERIRVDASSSDGGRVVAGATVASVNGPLRAILTAERTALNFIQRLSGIATLTSRFIALVPGVEVRDTRKTTPGWRALEKAAVRAGGGTNHRNDLSAAILIKDNHIAAAGGVAAAVAGARGTFPGAHVEVECDSLEQVRVALDAGADELLLDNMALEVLNEAVTIAKGRARTEASGRVTLATIEQIAASGVDAISVGALTHSAPSIDLSLEVVVG